MTLHRVYTLGDTTMDSERMLKILLEIGNRVKPPVRESEEDAATRAQLQSEVDVIHAKGGIIDIPSEWP